LGLEKNATSANIGHHSCAVATLQNVLRRRRNWESAMPSTLNSETATAEARIVGHPTIHLFLIKGSWHARFLVSREFSRKGARHQNAAFLGGPIFGLVLTA
jgi:hypothetical protein